MPLYSLTQNIDCRDAFVNGDKFTYEDKSLVGKIFIKKNIHIEKIKRNGNKVVSIFSSNQKTNPEI